MSRVSTIAGCILLCCITARASESSASGSSPAPPSLSTGNGRSEESAQDEALESGKKIRELGILEGRERNTHFLHPIKKEIAYDEQEGPYAGRNRKKKKHRRLYAVEVQARKLEQSGGLKSDGSLDVGGLLKLAQAEEERAQAPGGIVQQKHWTMEELDIAYPTLEGNVRLGLVDAADVAAPKVRAKFERSSHLVSMRAPGTVAGLISDEMLNYRLETQNTTLLVLGSKGHLYSIVVQPDFAVGTLKEMVWELERQHRDADADKKNAYKVQRQRLLLERGIPNAADPPAPLPFPALSPVVSDTQLLGPDIRTLAWYNITDYDVIFVLPPLPKVTAEEQEAFSFTCFNAAYDREINKRLAETEDEDDKDPVYRVVKKAYLDAEEETFQTLFLSNGHFKAGYDELLEKDPNFALRPHPRLDPTGLEKMQATFDDMLAPDYLDRMWAEIEEQDTDAEVVAEREQAIKKHEEEIQQAGLPPLYMTTACFEDMQRQQFQRQLLYLPLIPETLKVQLLQKVAETHSSPHDASVPATSPGRPEVGGGGGGSGKRGQEEEEAMSRPAWMMKKNGVQDVDRHGQPYVFDVDNEYVQELQAYKNKMIDEWNREAQRREGKTAKKTDSSDLGVPNLAFNSNPWVHD
jgi:hypothetical protein